MVHPTANPAAAPSKMNTSTFVFTEVHDSFIYFYLSEMRVEFDMLTTLFNRVFKTSLNEETIRCAAHRVRCDAEAYVMLTHGT